MFCSIFDKVISKSIFLTSLFISLKASLSLQIQSKIGLGLALLCFSDGNDLTIVPMDTHFSLPCISAVHSCGLFHLPI